MVATGQKVEELDKERDFPVTIFSGLDKPSGVPGLLDSWVTHPAPRPPCGAPVASAPAGGARARLKGAAGSGWPQWRTAAAVRGQERSSRGCSAARTGPSTPGDGHPTALPLRAPSLRPAPCRPPALGTPHPGLPMAPEAGASPRPLPWAALLLLAALLPVASSAGPPGTRLRGSTVGRLSFSLPALLSLWGPLPRSDSVLPACVSFH